MRHTYVFGPISSLVAAMLCALLASGAQAQQTFFQQAQGEPGVVVTYDEIVAEDIVRAGGVAQQANGESSSVKGTTLPCITGFDHGNCSRGYDGGTASRPRGRSPA